MLKAWVKRDDEALLILGLTFVNSIRDSRNHVSLWREKFDTPVDVALITAPSRAEITNTIKRSNQRILITRKEPVLHYVTRKQEDQTLYVCLSQPELLLLRNHPLTSYYRLNGHKIQISFDTLIIGGTDENDMRRFLTRVNMIDIDTHVEMDQTQIRC